MALLCSIWRGNPQGFAASALLWLLWTVAISSEGTATQAVDAPELPYLMDMQQLPKKEEVCGHCPIIEANFNRLRREQKRGRNNLTLFEMACCGICQLDNYNCMSEGRRQIPLVRAWVQQYQDYMGFDFHEFTPEELFARIRGRTLWFMGDSQMRPVYAAAECFLRKFAVDNVRTRVSDDPRLDKEATPARLEPSYCLRLQHNTRVCSLRFNVVGNLLRIFNGLMTYGGEEVPADVAVINVGLHYKDGEVADKYLKEINILADFIRENRARLPQLLWMQTTPQSFVSRTGGFHSAVATGSCQPLHAWYHGEHTVAGGGPRNLVATPVMDSIAVPVFDIWNATLPFWNFHRGGMDCTHFCNPGPHQVWTYLLNESLRDSKLGNPVNAADVAKAL